MNADCWGVVWDWLPLADYPRVRLVCKRWHRLWIARAAHKIGQPGVLKTARSYHRFYYSRGAGPEPILTTCYDYVVSPACPYGAVQFRSHRGTAIIQPYRANKALPMAPSATEPTQIQPK